MTSGVPIPAIHSASGGSGAEVRAEGVAEGGEDQLDGIDERPVEIEEERERAAGRAPSALAGEPARAAGELRGSGVGDRLEGHVREDVDIDHDVGVGALPLPLVGDLHVLAHLEGGEQAAEFGDRRDGRPSIARSSSPEWSPAAAQAPVGRMIAMRSGESGGALSGRMT